MSKYQQNTPMKRKPLTMDTEIKRQERFDLKK